MKTRYAFALAAMLALLHAVDAAGQTMSPVNPKFLEWQKRRAAAPVTTTNAPSRKPLRGAMSAGDGDETEETGFGLVPTVMDMDYLADINAGVVRAPIGGFPSSYDLRAQGRVSPVRDQGDYGTCWAFAAMGSLESWVAGNEGGSADFSENNLANLHGWDWGFDEGGNASMATAYFVRWGGPVAESSDPYPVVGGSQALAPVRHIQKVVWVPGKSDSLDNDAIKEAVMERGALYVSYYHASSYYKSATTSYFYPGSRSSNHAVTIVGWDDDYPASNFATRPSGNGAYLVRNSWGADWGGAGYYWVSYYDGVFARSTMYSFCNAEPAGNYGKIYQHDPLGMVSAFSASWGANMFAATGADSIAAVGFYSLAPKTSYSISVYTGCQSGKPTSGTCALTQAGTASEPGYVTVPLSQTVSVASGTRFSIVIKLTTPGYSYPHAIEYAYTGITSGAGAAAGQSFYSSNGHSWNDLTSVNGTANFCIKAYTAAAVAPPDLASISISGPSTVESGKTAVYSCTAKYTDSSERTVSADWSVVSGSSYASIASDGTLTAAETAIDGTVVIRAAYAERGVAKSADWQLTVTAGPPQAPTGLSATQGTETRAVRLSWTAASGADAYAIYRSATDSSANAAYIGVAEATKYSDTSAVPGRDYRYFIKARNSSGTGPFSEGASGWRALSAPADVAASDGTSLDGVAVSWSAAEGAARYRVSRADSIEGDFAPVSGWIETTEFFDGTAVAGVKYRYSVIAATDASGSRPSERGVPDDGFRAIPILPESLAVEGAASIASGATSAYSAFAVYSDGSRGVSPVSPTWHVSKGSVARNGTVTAPVVSTNEEVMLTASTTLEGIAVSGSKVILVTAVAPSAPTGVVASASSPSQGVAVAWYAVPGASGYRVYRSVGAPPVQSCIGAVSTTNFTDNTATPGVAYEYRVSAVNGAGESAMSDPATATVPLAAPTGLAATVDREDCVRVAWNAVAGATRYRAARAESANGEKTPLGAWASALSFDDVPPFAGTNYLYFAQAATDDSGANAGPWSEPAEGRMKPPQTLVSLSIAGPDQAPSSGEAVYSCTANCSDGTSESVRPAWSATGSAAIDRDGRLTALAVTSDATATVAAYFQGKRATKSVTIVAPKAATATVTSVFAAQRWPYSGLVDIDYTLEASPADTLATISVSATDRDHARALAATTLTGDGSSGPVSAGSHRITWNLAADHPGFHAAAMDVSIEAVPFVLLPPTGLTASQGTSTRGIDLAWSAVENATGYEVWRAKGSMNSADATLAATVTDGTTYADTSVTPGDIYFYWLKTVTSYGTSEFSSSAFGYRARVTVTVAFDGNGGTPSVASISGVAGNAYGTIPTATREGYDFAGWFTAASGGVQATAASLFDESVTTLYAHWMAKTYDVTLDRQNGSGGTASVTATYGAAMPAITVPTRAGFTFVGYWTEAEGGGTMFYDGSGAGVRTWHGTAATTLYAKWVSGENLPTGGDLHVDATTGRDTNDGRSWATAKASIQAAIDVATTNDLVLVNDGSYEPIDSKGMPIEIRSVNGAAATIIDGGGTNRCATLGSSTNDVVKTTLVGFTLQNGNADVGGGAKGGIIEECIVQNNASTLESGDHCGGGAVHSVLHRCIVRNNRCVDDGGGASGSVLYDCLVIDNHAANCHGGGAGGGVDSSTAIHCTIVGNTAQKDTGSAGPGGAGVSDSVLSGCIVYGNQYTDGTDGDIFKTSATYSCFSSVVSGTGNIVADPLFVDAANGDYRLRSGSPCIDAGELANDAMMETDLAGHPRWIGVGTDIGCYEYGTHYEATTQYVSAASGDDANDGLTWETAKKTIQSAIDWAADGDEIIVADGVYAEGQLTNWRNSHLFIRSVNGAAATIIDGANQQTCVVMASRLPTEPASSYAFQLRSDYVTMDGFTLQNGYTRWGGAASIAVTLKNCILTKNTSGTHGVAHGSRLENCLVVGNVNMNSNQNDSSSSAANWCSLINCTIVANTNMNTATIGARSVANSAVTNCVIVGNVAVNVPLASEVDESCEVGYSCLDTATAGMSNLVATAADVFFNAAGGDYRLRVGSPCIDAGTNAYATGSTDLAGNARIIGGMVDLGAYEGGINGIAVTLDRQGGSGGTMAVAATFGEALPTITVPTRIGYTFDGYWTEANGGGTQYYTASGTSALLWDKTSATTLYAKWTVNTYIVTLDRQSGTGGSSSVTATYGSAMPAITVPTRTDYTFGGYYTSTGGGGTQYYTASGASARAWNLTTDTTLYAHWTANAGSREKVQLWEGGPYWATTNIGAERPEDYGLYFWWGDTVGYRRENDAWVASDGSSANFSFYNDPISRQTYGNSVETLRSEGWIVTRDGTDVLAPEHDAAHVHWGGNWRIPTSSELSALNSNCDWTWTMQNGVNGYVVRGRGDYASASIFLPAAGFGDGTSLRDAGSNGYYWSSVRYGNYHDYSWFLYFYSGGHYTSDGGRYSGLSVRPVQVFAE